MRTFQAVFAGCTLLAASAYGAYCHGKPAADAPANPNPINTDAPKFVRKNDHGAVYEAGRPGYEFHVIHLYGTAYEVRLSKMLGWRRPHVQLETFFCAFPALQ